jgi:hypothetical protein
MVVAPAASVAERSICTSEQCARHRLRRILTRGEDELVDALLQDAVACWCVSLGALVLHGEADGALVDILPRLAQVVRLAAWGVVIALAVGKVGRILAGKLPC